MKYLFLTGLICFLFILPALSQSDPDSLEISVRKVLEEGDDLASARALYRLGRAYDRRNLPEKSNKTLEQALHYAERSGSSRAIAVVTNYLAGNYSEQGRTGDAITLYKKAYHLFLSNHDTSSAASIALNLGGEYLNRGDYEKALETELEALKLKEQAGDPSNIAYFYQQLGEVYKLLDMREKWKEYLYRAEELSENPEYAAFKTRIAILNDAAGIRAGEGDTEKALAVYRKMFLLSEKEGFNKGQYIALSNMSSLLLKQQRREEAVALAEKAYRLAAEEGDLYNRMAQANLAGDARLASGEPAKAAAWYRRALESAGGSYPDEMKHSFFGLYSVYEKTDDPAKALDYLEKYMAVKDSLEDVAVKNKVRELETIYQTEKKNNRIRSLNQQSLLQRQQIRSQRLMIWIIVLIVLFLLMAGYFAWRQYRLKTRNKEIMLQQQLLRSQMNPHFLFNSLGAIQSFMYSHETKKAAFYLGSFASLMRAILEHSRRELIPLEEETETLKNYLELQKMRLGFRYEILLPEDLDPGAYLLPPMLIQPFVENAIEHGVKDLGEKGVIRINIERKDNKLIVMVEDNGPGIGSAPARKKGHRSLAMTLFRERIAFLSSYLKKQIVYKILDKNETNPEETGTKVIIELPVIND
jgi:tetratricopeptide (TPR) repeat protein